MRWSVIRPSWRSSANPAAAAPSAPASPPSASARPECRRRASGSGGFGEGHPVEVAAAFQRLAEAYGVHLVVVQFEDAADFKPAAGQDQAGAFLERGDG